MVLREAAGQVAPSMSCYTSLSLTTWFHLSIWADLLASMRCASGVGRKVTCDCTLERWGEGQRMSLVDARTMRSSDDGDLRSLQEGLLDGWMMEIGLRAGWTCVWGCEFSVGGYGKFLG